MLVSKLRSGASKRKAGAIGLVRVALFWKFHCKICSLAYVILYLVTGSCKEPFDVLSTTTTTTAADNNSNVIIIIIMIIIIIIININNNKSNNNNKIVDECKLTVRDIFRVDFSIFLSVLF